MNAEKNLRKSAVIALALVIALGLSSVCLAEADTWMRKANMPTARTSLSTSAVGGKIYAIGGRTSTSNAGTSIVEEYDPMTDTWTKKADMPTPRMCDTCAVNGKIYAIGGTQGPPFFDPLATVEEYDPATDTWTRKADMSMARRCPVSAVNGKIYAIGGRGEQFGGTGDNGEDLAIVEEYDPATDTWTRKTDMPTVRSGPSTCVVNGKIYAIGGYTGIVEQGARIYSTVEEYDPATDSWTTRTPMATARAAFATCAVYGKIYAFAGTPFTTYYSTTEEYDVATDTWARKTDIPTPRSNFGASMVNGKIYVIGGRTWGDTVIATVEEYDTGLIATYPDFNGDGIIDIKDLLRLMESWGQDNPMVDIAPQFGDGIVNVLDLELLMSYWKQPVDDPTLLAHWALDEIEGDTAYDSAGVNDALVAGNPVWLPNDGQVQGAIQLDGIDDCVIANLVLNPALGPFSVFTWIKGGLPGQVVISGPMSASWLSTDPLTGNLMTEIKGAGRSGKPLQSQTLINDGNWHRIGLVWDGLNRTLYVDDRIVAEDTQKGLESSNDGLYIGCGKNMEPGTFWSGLIDDVRIYKRVVIP
jgi:N-acetylneuraminic acid mutarotase